MFVVGAILVVAPIRRLGRMRYARTNWRWQFLENGRMRFARTGMRFVGAYGIRPALKLGEYDLSF